MNQIVTVFNRYDTQGESRYYATAIENAHLRVDKRAAISKSGLKDADSMWCSVEYYREGSDVYIGNKKYLPPVKWSKQVNDDKEKTITFTEGKDVLFDGVWEGPEVIEDAEYGATGFLNYLRKNFDGIYLIDSAAQYDMIPHFELGGN